MDEKIISTLGHLDQLFKTFEIGQLTEQNQMQFIYRPNKYYITELLS